MGQAKRRGTYEERVRQATKDNIPCDLLIIKRSTRIPTLEFQYSQGTVPAKPRVGRDDAINALHNDWGHDAKYSQIAGEYIAHSPSLQMARQGLQAKITLNHATGREQHIDLENLGCVIEFELNGKEIGTAGPQWCSPEQVRAQSAKLKQENRHTHSIRERQPA